jgi:methyl-accepting chemotaxis protein
MTDTDLKKIVEQQAKQIDLLKNAVKLLERQIKQVAVNANRAQHAARRLTEEVRVINQRKG